MSDAAQLSAALLLGLLGSLHCVVMCGPLALALPVRSGAAGWRGMLASRLAYNLGRAATYALLGAVVGLLGHGLALVGLQRVLSLLAAGAIVGHLLARWSVGQRLLSRLRPRGLPARPLLAWAVRLQSLMAPRLRGASTPAGRGESWISAWTFGMLNGLLPCGLVGVALAGAAASAGPLSGATFMLAFGLGTLPLMLLTALFGGAVAARWGGSLRRWAPLALGVLALLFLWRGLAVPAAAVAEGTHAAVHPPGCPLR